MTAKKKNRRGFTFIEIIIVTSIIAVLAAVAMSIYFSSKHAAERRICVANLKQIQAVISSWALDANAGPDTVITTAELVPNYIKVWPTEGTVEYPVPVSINTVPVCPNAETKPDHKI